MDRCLYCKFSQNPGLLKALLKTGRARLFEASPCDKIWGTGLTEDQHRCKLPCQGLNLLGQCLERVRNQLKLSLKK